MVDHEVTSFPSTSHSFLSDSRLSEDNELSHEELVEALSQVCCKLKSVNKEKKSLQKFFESLLFEKKLQKDLSKAISEKRSLEEKVEEMIKRSTPQNNQQETMSKLTFENKYLNFFKKNSLLLKNL